jgi:hypothetical protein
MPTNLDRFRSDLEALIKRGDRLHLAIQAECFPEEFARQTKELGDQVAEAVKELPSFGSDYQTWYSEAKAAVKQLLPDRLSDFVRHYEKPKPRREITAESYRIEDCLQGISITRGREWEIDREKVVGPEAAIPHFRQQLAILKSVTARFDSTLFDIRQLVQADLFDSELDAAQELLKNKFVRAAGALGGVVLERHLVQVCDNHGLRLAKKAPGISDLNNALKEANLIDVPQWRFIQHLGDIRNLCDHSKAAEPTAEQVADLLTGVAKVTKTVY